MSAADPGRVLAALPVALWPSLLQAVRTAADRLGRAHLPSGLQPYAGFTPAKLGRGRAKQAVAAALADDARLREAVGDALGEELRRSAAALPVSELVDRFGHARAAAALVAQARWAELDQVAGTLPAPAPPREQPPTPPRRSAEVPADAAALRKERDAATRRATAAEKRVAALQPEVAALRQSLDQAEAERDAARRQADQERTRSRDRLARLQRRVSDAEAQARSEAARYTGVAAELERLAGILRGVPEPVADAGVEGPAPAPAAIPRSVRAATPGRPSVLPRGLIDGQPAAVESLLAMTGVELLLDGYNLTKDLRGVPGAELPAQRAWLVQLAAAVAAPRELRVSIVFDGAGDRTAAASAARVVRCIYTADGETADERIVEMVRALPNDQPVVVVTSDREVQAACEQLGANVVASGAFLKAVA